MKLAQEKTIRGSCQCGKATFTFNLPKGSLLPLSANLCHCNISRRISGVLCTAYIPVPSSNGLPRPDLASLTAYQSSHVLKRWFCSSCGSHMYLEYASDGHFEVATGVLDKSDTIIQFTRHMYIGDTTDGGASNWIPNVNGRKLERWYAAPHESVALAEGWKTEIGKQDGQKAILSGESAAELYKDKELLHAHCHCGGVEFFIQRPNKDSLEARSPFPDLLVPYHSGSSENPRDVPWWLRTNNTRYLAGTCACNSCRQSAGFEFVQWAFVPTANILLADGKPFSRDFGTLKVYHSSDGVTRRFCGCCGATAFWDGDWRPTLIDVAVGLLDAPSGARAKEWLDWETGRVSFREFAHNEGLIDGLEDGLRAWGQSRDKS